MKALTVEMGMERLVLVVQELSLARDLETVMKIVRREARELTGADGATFVLRDNGLCYYADEDAIAPLWKGRRFPMETCISGWAMLNKQPAVVPDIYTDDRIPIDAYRPTFVKSLAMVPIRTIEPIGAIGNYWAQPHIPTADELKLLQSLADITAVTMENVQLYADLEQRVQERTVQLQAVNKELEAFSYSVSHDLRAPLRAVHGYTRMLVEDYGDKMEEGAKRLTDKILANAGNMSKLIDDLLAFFRMGKKDLVKAATNISDMVNEICRLQREQEAPRIIEFVIAGLPQAFADATLLKQVFTNLISNGVKYSRNKENAIVEIGSMDKEDEIIYYVKDNGAGFDMKYAGKLFKVFQRLHSNEEFEGTGIGLAIVSKIVSKHGGRVWAEAKVNEGAAFYFSLPKP